ncbi:protein jag [Rarobacter incanus]|uniref:SpoIIIJ-associated protein n=1 Tax=Rarobacter incanus TaxID=153494 RepID=A0A542SR52_9MICO|nr:R3H domain-containing nucleic acid-binding protein [Rarobacter incanus]TQK76687.1 spoIIIJ-associated protein [Rarobacter incanus]
MSSQDEANVAEVEVSKTKVLEEEGEVAADYLEEFLDIVDLDGDIDIDVEHDRASLAIVADDPKELQGLVGREGEVLEALQELTRLAVQTRTGDRSRLMLDVAGFRAHRRNELRALAEATVNDVKVKGQAIALPAMNAFERKVVHDVITEAGLSSESFGTDPNRYIKVSL